MNAFLGTYVTGALTLRPVAAWMRGMDFAEEQSRR